MPSIITIQFFKFKDSSSKWFAFKQMYLAHQQLKLIEGLEFYKLMGSGGGSGFSLKPDLSTYALLTVFQSESYKAKFQNSTWYRTYIQNSSSHTEADLLPVKGHGTWNGKSLFTETTALKPDDVVGVITRAAIKPGFAPYFWLFVKAIAKAILKQKDLIYAKGIGTIPVFELATLSIWKNEKAVENFAYKKKPHSTAVKRSRKIKWFSEELFMRFVFKGDLEKWKPFILNKTVKH